MNVISTTMAGRGTDRLLASRVSRWKAVRLLKTCWLLLVGRKDELCSGRSRLSGDDVDRLGHVPRVAALLAALGTVPGRNRAGLRSLVVPHARQWLESWNGRLSGPSLAGMEAERAWHAWACRQGSDHPFTDLVKSALRRIDARPRKAGSGTSDLPESERLRRQRRRALAAYYDAQDPQRYVKALRRRGRLRLVRDLAAFLVERLTAAAAERSLPELQPPQGATSVTWPSPAASGDAGGGAGWEMSPEHRKPE